MASITQEPSKSRRYNWWKIGFFVALFAFEVAREWAVIDANEEPRLATLATVASWNGIVTAEGRWTRIDGGERLTPTIARIECSQDTGECNEIYMQVNKQFVGAPTLSTYKAQFSPDAVTYRNDGSICVTYDTRIDLKLKKTFAVRTKKPDKNPMCRNMESRMEMQLGDGWVDQKDPLKGHFLPVAATIVAIVNLFTGSKS